jgi:ribosomal protein S18 acetylase RimI-like enzyme
VDSIYPLHNQSQFIVPIDSLSVRPLELADTYSVAEVITNSFHREILISQWFKPLFRLGIAEDLRHRLKTPPLNQQVCLVAQLNNFSESLIVGTVEVGLRSGVIPASNGKYPYIANLAVSKEFRRQGIGRRMLLRCEQLVREWGFKDVYLHVMADNESACKLYSKLGFKIINTDFRYNWFFIRKPNRFLLHKDLSVNPPN